MDKTIKLFILIFIPISLFAHSLIINLIDNEDGTITIVGAFSTGESASGALVKIQANESKKILLEKRLDDESEITIKIPDIPYTVILDGGSGHSISKEGIAPKEGFKKSEKVKTKAKTKENKQVNPTLKILFSIAFLLFISTILISIFNTNRLLKK